MQTCQNNNFTDVKQQLKKTVVNSGYKISKQEDLYLIRSKRSERLYVQIIKVKLMLDVHVYFSNVMKWCATNEWRMDGNRRTKKTGCKALPIPFGRHLFMVIMMFLLSWRQSSDASQLDGFSSRAQGKLWINQFEQLSIQN
ncbi:hypothetical protein T07_8269 [Trichinella nelsoni]|uniref:Uncharacterized protein n=1 Tax=Trichinella nelsoni TaxID=6336 RepID=A0A0V0S8H0_9BILA|nr:hypothetical protein T07_8269 [Trichinella nelsoni]